MSGGGESVLDARADAGDEAADAWIVRTRARTGRIFSELLGRGQETSGMLDHLGSAVRNHTIESLSVALTFSREYIRECVALHDLVVRQRAERTPTVIDMGVGLMEAQIAAGVRDAQGVFNSGYAMTSNDRWRQEVV